MPRHKLPLFSRNVVLLSIVSFLNDIGGETIKKTIPLYLSLVVGVKPSVIGIIEGISDATPQLLQPVSGYFSDRFSRRKPFVIIGQILRSLVLLLSFAVNWPEILLIRVIDRSGKGIANAPRDALVTDSSRKGTVGRSFGLTRAFDNAGAVFGFLLTAGTLYILQQFGQTTMTKELFQFFVFLAVIPLIIAFGIVVFGIRERKQNPVHAQVEWKPLGRTFWVYLGVCVLFTLGNSSDAFLMFRARELQVQLYLLFVFLALYSGVSSLSGLVFSSLSDQIGRKKILLLGWLLYASIYFLFTSAVTTYHLTILFLFYGIYLGLTEGTMKAWVADVVPSQSRGTAYGIFNMATGLTLLPASLLTGYLWQQFGLSTALRVDGTIALVAVILLVFMKK